MKKFMMAHLLPYDAFAHILLQDERAGLSSTVATCDAETVLEDTPLKELASGPLTCLFELPLGPADGRPAVQVGAGCKKVALAARRSGLQRWGPKGVVRHVGVRPIVLGVFAVAKGGIDKTRMVSAAVPANEQLNMRLVWEPVFLNMGQFAVLKVWRGARLEVSKRDVRHCYHLIRSTRSWRRRLAHPPPPDGKVRRTLDKVRHFPVHCVWPVGFGAGSMFLRLSSVKVPTLSFSSKKRPLRSPSRPPRWGKPRGGLKPVPKSSLTPPCNCICSQGPPPRLAPDEIEFLGSGANLWHYSRCACVRCRGTSRCLHIIFRPGHVPRASRCLWCAAGCGTDSEDNDVATLHAIATSPNDKGLSTMTGTFGDIIFIGDKSLGVEAGPLGYDRSVARFTEAGRALLPAARLPEPVKRQSLASESTFVGRPLPAVSCASTLFIEAWAAIEEALAEEYCDVVTVAVPGFKPQIWNRLRGEFLFDHRVVLENRRVGSALLRNQKWFAPPDRNALLAGMTYSKFVRLFKALLVLRIPLGEWRTLSLRRRSSSAMMEHGLSFEFIRLFERWALESSCGEYSRLGLSAPTRINGRISPEHWALDETFGSAVDRAFGLAASGVVG